MIVNYFKTAWRNLIKDKLFSIVNILGLTIGLTSFVLIALYIFDELTFDKSHRNAATIYRVVENKTTPEGKGSRIAGAGYQVSERAKTDFPEVADVVRLIRLNRTNVSTTDNAAVFYENYTLGNPGFLTTFDFPLLAGNRANALTEPHSVVLTESMARKLFNTADVLGRSIKTDSDSMTCKITAVLKDFPVNSHLSFNLLFSESSITNAGFSEFINTDWNSGAFSTYLLLKNKGAAANVATKLNKLVALNEKEGSDKMTLSLQPITDIHFYSNDIEGDSGKKGNITYIYVFSIIAIFILFIACINYMNLTTARFANRAKEIAVRKVAGASRGVLVRQFLSETFLMTAIAFIISCGVVNLLLPSFNAFTEKHLTFGLDSDYRLWMGLALTLLVVGFLSGIYPALFQSRLKPLQLFKSKISLGKGNLSLRRSLVVFQFAISIVMIIVTMMVYMQMKYINSKDLGFRRDQLLVVDINSGKVRKAAETIKAEFSKIAQVKDVSVSSRVPGEWKDLPIIKVANEKTQSPQGDDMYFMGIDDRFISTYQIKLLKGRNFLQGSLADSSSVIVNETAAKQLGIMTPAGQMVTIVDDDPLRVNVIGIVADFNFRSLREPVTAMMLGYKQNPIQSIDYFTASISADKTSETLAQMDAILRSIDKSHLFEYHFLDKQWQLFYREDEIRQTIFLMGAILTIFIACLGLFGLATYSAVQRIKEVGIRKVLGASVGGIIAELSKDFVKLVMIALLIAFPVAWWAVNEWLSDFAYRVRIEWWVFAVAALAALSIAVFTVGVQAFRAAISNPVKSLRNE